jgi:hypothetical protein
VTPALTADAVRRWRQRLPRLALVLAVAVPLTALVLAETFSETCSPSAPCRAPLDSLAYPAAAVAQVLAMGTPVLAFLLPRAAVWTALASATLLAGPATVGSSFPALWRWAALWFAVVALADLLGRWRQVVESHAWGSPTLRYPDPGPDEGPVGDASPHRLARDEDTRGAALVVAGLAVAVFGAMLAWHLQGTATVRDFEAHAFRTEAPVTKVDPDGLSVTLRLDGRDVELEPTASYEVGQTVPVLVDAADPGHVALVAEPDDPSWRLGLGALALAVLLGLAARLWARGAGRWTLWHRGGPAVRALVGRQGPTVLVTTLDDPGFRRPVCLVAGLQPSAMLLPLDRVSAHAAAYPFDDEDEWDDAGGELQGHEPPDVASLSDSELAAWADQEVEALEALEDDDVPPPPDVPLAVDGGAAATVVGLRHDGDPLLLLLDDGPSLVSRGAARDPWTWRRLRDRLVQVRPRERAAGPQRSVRPPATTRPERPDHRRARLAGLVGVLSPAGLLVAYAVALAAYPAARWLLDGEAGWGELFPIVVGGSTLAEGLVFLAAINHPPLASRPGALLHRGRWFDELLPVERVRAVAPGRSSVVLRLSDPDDALALPPQAVVRFADHLAAPDTTPEQAVFAVEQLLRLATPSGRRGWRRPSVSLVPGALLMVGLLAAWGQTKFG